MNTNLNELLTSQAVGLPEDILKRKWAGDFEGAIAAINARLTRDIPQLLRDRLTIEREIIRRLPAQYPYKKAEAMAAIREVVPDFTEAEFDRIAIEGGMDFIYVQGEPRFFESVASTVLDWDRSLLPRAGRDATGARPALDGAIAELKEKGTLGYRVKLKVDYHITEAAFIPGETYRVHLPVPKPCAQQSNIEILAEPGATIAPECAPQRTVFYERKLEANRPFSVEYSYDSRVHYIDLAQRPKVAGPLYAGVPEPTIEDLGELRPHILFTPYLKELAKQIRGELQDEVLIARAAYDYVTQHVTYSYLRDYALIDNMSEYMALGLRGDCGAQTLLFMGLCRLNGIATRWQSGTCARPDALGAHDWCQFYVEEYGWLLCDVSFGGGSWRAGRLERWNFYFGNLDPYRMVANDRYMGGLEPEVLALRGDPYDNQSGECEVQGRMLANEERRVVRALTLEKL